ncbi:hypothetical protein FQZ97_1090770 [compost metagenome]
MRLGNGGYFRQIMQAQAGVGQRLHPYHARGRCQASGQAQLRGIYHPDAKALTHLTKKVFGAAIQRAKKHDFITRVEQPQ